MKSIFKFFTNPWFLSVLGLIFISIFIYLAGPLLGIGDSFEENIASESVPKPRTPMCPTLADVIQPVAFDARAGPPTPPSSPPDLKNDIYRIPSASLNEN